ncbi:MAG: preprotein translocase subunit SecG [Betaproteobacteria bacterium]|jgi:preprotein translocase subunit SecG|nr:preprotein translocase subunit SecG [Betaproteobacteria bacterium]MBU6512050.1 preprotein translocase subunit SecG [Betaproteobacteria bacterium]MDE1954809.1 preprotein translocase subunit SecG [Betaproteobacteria bacterium]MDE2152239.1 preprotein translocase subunit SecG [Betaproteobacteria bacterium]MDE2479341.1 preprotein translocase subunit SecG [Betaproteobacteria bacterium]
MTLVLNLILVVQILSAMSMVGLILLQHGKGADMGASFGSGASGSLFGATGSANFLSRSTAAAASIFFVCTLALAYFGTRPVDNGGGVMGELAGKTLAPQGAPAASKPAPAGSQGGVAQIPGSVQAPAAASVPAKAKP